MLEEDVGLSNEADYLPLDALPPDCVMENVLELMEKQQCHRITFYQASNVQWIHDDEGELQ